MFHLVGMLLTPSICDPIPDSLGTPPPSPAPDSPIPAPPRLGVSTEEGWGEKAQGLGVVRQPKSQF